MKKCLIIGASLLMMTACNAEPTQTTTPKQENPAMNNTIVRTVQLTANNQTFDIQLENNATAQKFFELLPLNMTMQDHLSNEKFAELPTPLPTNDSVIGNIQAGDVLLFQGDTLVVFYENHSSRYRYTRIGKVTNPANLKNTLGSASVDVKLGR